MTSCILSRVKRKLRYSLAFLNFKNLFSYFRKIEVAHLWILWSLLQEQKLGVCPPVRFQHSWDQHSSYAFIWTQCSMLPILCAYGAWLIKTFCIFPLGMGSIWYENDPSPALQDILKPPYLLAVLIPAQKRTCLELSLWNSNMVFIKNGYWYSSSFYRYFYSKIYTIFTWTSS